MRRFSSLFEVEAPIYFFLSSKIFLNRTLHQNPQNNHSKLKKVFSKAFYCISSRHYWGFQFQSKSESVSNLQVKNQAQIMNQESKIRNNILKLVGKCETNYFYKFLHFILRKHGRIIFLFCNQELKYLCKVFIKYYVVQKSILRPFYTLRRRHAMGNIWWNSALFKQLTCY